MRRIIFEIIGSAALVWVLCAAFGMQVNWRVFAVAFITGKAFLAVADRIGGGTK